MLDEDTMQKHYLVTGGCGFIGSHLVDILIEQGHRVTILDDLSTGKKENAHPKATLVVGDTTDYETVESVFKNIDGCFHLAAVASVEKSVIDWARTHTVNSTSTVNVFQASSRSEHKVPVVYTSSAAVYGECEEVPIHEKIVPSPITAYGVDKYSCDLQGRVAWEVHKVPNIGLRPFNVYGPRQDPHSPYSGVISIFTNRLLSGSSITIYGDGSQVRDFVYVEDAVKVFLTAMEKLHDPNRDYGHDIINLCTGRPTFINKLAYTIGDVIGCQMRVNYAPPRKGDIQISIGDPTRLSSQLGLRLNVQLEEGLERLVSYLHTTEGEKKAA